MGFRPFPCFWLSRFVLDKCLQDDDSLPKWKARSWIGVYLGHSLARSGNVPLVYLQAMFLWHTTCRTPQLHVIFDDQFTIVSGPHATLPLSTCNQLYEKAVWKRTDTTYSGLHLFDTYCFDPPHDTQTV